MDWRERIVSDENILLDKPTIKGTRISVELLLELIESGWNEEMILRSYPKTNSNYIKFILVNIEEIKDGINVSNFVF
jgi:uncharacterized protein (DUF433 family)